MMYHLYHLCNYIQQQALDSDIEEDPEVDSEAETVEDTSAPLDPVSENNKSNDIFPY